MENQDNEERYSRITANSGLSHVKQLKEYEQSTVDSINQQLSALNEKKQVLCQTTEELKQLQTTLIQYSQNNELGDFYKSNLYKEINDLRQSSVEINRSLYETFAVLRSIEGLSVTCRNIVRKKQTKLEQDKNLMNKNVVNLQGELDKLRLEHEESLKKLDIEHSTIKKEIEEGVELGKNVEEEVNILLGEISNLENELKSNENGVEAKEKYLFDLKCENEGLHLEIAGLEEEISQYETKLNNNKLENEKFTMLELNLQESMENICKEIVVVKEENAHLENHEVFQLSKEEENSHENITNKFTLELNELKQNVSCVQNNILEENAAKDRLFEEITKIEANTNLHKQKILEVDEQMKILRGKDTEKLLKDCRESAKSTFDQIFNMNAEVTQLNLQIADLEMKIATTLFVTDKEISAINLENDNLDRELETKFKQMEEDYQKFLVEYDAMRKECEKKMAAKFSGIQEKLNEVDKKVQELTQEETNVDAILQGVLVECDIFTRKLKVTKEAQHNLKKEIKNFQKPKQAVQRKRDLDEMSDSSFTGLMSIKDCIEYRKAKEAKMVRKK